MHIDRNFFIFHSNLRLRSKQQDWNNLETLRFSQIVQTREGNSLVWSFKEYLKLIVSSPVNIWKYVQDALPNVPVISRYHSLLATSKQIEAYRGLHLPEGVLSYHDETTGSTPRSQIPNIIPCLSLPMAVVAYVTSLFFTCQVERHGQFPNGKVSPPGQMETLFFFLYNAL